MHPLVLTRGMRFGAEREGMGTAGRVEDLQVVEEVGTESVSGELGNE